MKPTEVQNLREAYMNEVWGDAFKGAREDNARDAARKKKIKPAPPSYGGAGALGTTGDALGARMLDGNKPKKTKPKKTSGLSKEQQAKLKADVDRRRKAGETADLRGGNDKVDGYGKAKTKSGGGGGGGRNTAPAAKNDSRNAEYTKKRSAIAKAKSPEDKAKATKDAESAGMAAWRKANPKLAAAKDKRDKTRGTAKSSNPLMKKYLKDRESRKEKLSQVRKDAKADSIAQSSNADKINKKETAIKDNIKSSMKNQALSDRAKAKAGQDPSKPTPKDQLPKGAQQARTGVPKAEAPKKDAAPKAAAPKADAPKAAAPAPSKAVTPPPSAKPSQPGAPIVATAKQFSKGGKYRRESLMSFGAYQLSEKKTSVKINPKLKDLEEDCLNEGSCSGHSEGGEIVNGRCSICGGTPKKSTKKEETAYVSQEEVSEESYQEGYETETDLTGREQLDEISDNMLKAIYPKGMSKGLKQTIKPGGSNALGVKNDATSAGGGKYFTNNARLLARAPAQYIRGVVPDAKKDAAPKKPAGPKPVQDMNLNRQGGPSSPPSGGANKPTSSKPKPAAPKANTSGLSGKKPSELLSKGGKVKKPVSEMTQQEIHEEYVQIQEFLGKIFKGVKNFVGGLFGGGRKQQQQQQQQPQQQSMKDYKPADGLKLKGSMNDNRPKISNSSGSNKPFSDSGKPSGAKPSDIADIKSGTPEKVDKGLPNRKDKKKDKRFDEEVECTSEYIGPDERTKMKNDIILAKRAMRASNAAKAKAMSDNERILKSLGKFGKTTPEECDK